MILDHSPVVIGNEHSCTISSTHLKRRGILIRDINIQNKLLFLFDRKYGQNFLFFFSLTPARIKTELNVDE